MAKSTTIDAYLAALPDDKRAALGKIRKAIVSAAPKAEECFSYGLPAFRDQGGLLAGFGASANHCAYYPMSGSVVEGLKRELFGYQTSKGAIRFEAARPLPAALVRKLVKARQAENVASTAKAQAKASAKRVAKTVPAKPAKARAVSNASAGRPAVAAVLRELERDASKQLRAHMATRYGIVTKDRVFGTPMAKIKELGRRLGRDHALALALWGTGIYEARMLASMVDEPEQVTSAQMDRWAKDFDNWAVADTLCFNLFDRTPHAFAKVLSWSRSEDEFVRRAAFALLASAALHGHGTDDDVLCALPLIEQVSTDRRNFVKKGASWALRAIGAKKSLALRTAARALARRLARSDDSTARWIGKDALREFRRKD